MKSLLKNPKIIIWLAFIVISLVIIAPNPTASGYVVTGVGNSTGSGIAVGDIIYGVNGEKATDATFFNEYRGIVTLDTNHGQRFVNVNGTLGVDVDTVPQTRLKFGLDIKGGVRAVIQPNTTDNATLDQIISTLQTRINVYGLRESSFRPVYINNQGFVEVSIAGGTKEELQNLIESQGKFEAKIPFTVTIAGNTSYINLDKKYAVVFNGSDALIDGNYVKPGGLFNLAGIDFVFNNNDDKKLNITATVFTGNDVVAVFFDPQRSRIEASGSAYRWSFGVQLSNRGAQNFAWVTQNINAVQSLQGGYLDAPIVFYLDNRLVDSLSISSSLKGRPETEISITGAAATMQDAIKIRSELQSILRSGALPTTVQIVQIDSISPTLGAGFLNNAAFAGFAAIIGVIIVVSLRYKKPRMVAPMVIISMSEVLIVLGVAVMIGWTIDLSAIAGIIASVGTGIDSQIIILDRTLRKEESGIETMREKLRKAFFVIFGSAGTVIAAMIPLIILGFGLLRGFAIVTIIGVLVGVLIARPAYGVIVEHMIKE
jgi:preprotein translocase subunit SecD